MSQGNANVPFSVATNMKDGILDVTIRGRVDTVNASELLQTMQQYQGRIRGIRMDLADMTYISSAGLRVFLMMYKELDDKSQFRVSNVSLSVREILRDTGLDELLMGN